MPAGKSDGRAAARRQRGRAAPASPIDTVLRLLLLHSEWWERLDPGDHELLASTHEPHGPLCAWLERYLNEHGNTAWAVLEQAVRETEWAAMLPWLVPESVLQDEVHFADLRRVVDGIWIKALQAEQEELILKVPTDPSAMDRWRQVEARRKQLLLAQKQPTLT